MHSPSELVRFTKRQLGSRLRPLLRRVHTPTLVRLDHAAWRRGASDEARLIAALVSPRRTAVDIGANAGAVTYLLSGLAPRVLAFEPNPRFRYLADALPENCVFHSLAVSDYSGESVLMIPEEGGVRLEQLAHLPRSGDTTATPHRPTFQSFEVQLAALDELTQEEDIGFVKIDVEGHELEVLRGSSRILTQCRPNLLIEIEERHAPGAPIAVQDYLSRFGYRGLLSFNGCLVDARTFNPSVHQRRSNVGPTGKRGSYANMFAFIHLS